MCKTGARRPRTGGCSELAEIAIAMASKVAIPEHAVTVTQGVDDLLTVKVNEHEFTGTLPEVWAWLDDLVQQLNVASDFEP